MAGRGAILTGEDTEDEEESGSEGEGASAAASVMRHGHIEGRLQSCSRRTPRPGTSRDKCYFIAAESLKNYEGIPVM